MPHENPAGPAGLNPRHAAHMAVYRLSALGDVVLTTGVLLFWQRELGGSFTVLTRAAFAPLFDGNPAVRRVVGLEPDDLRGPRQRELFRRLAAELAGVPLVDLHGTLRSRLLAARWRGPVFRYPKSALARRLFLLSRGACCGAALLRRNVPQRYARALLPDRLVPPPDALLPRIFLTPDELARADAALAPLLAPLSAANEGFPPPLVALHPFATHEAKTWPFERWLRLAALLRERGIPHFWVGQGRAEGLPPAADFVNKTDLRALAALLARADALVTGDSGPMHIAAAVGTPVAALFGPTCREWGFFPQGANDVALQADMPCRPCSLHGKNAACPGGKQSLRPCMAALTPEAALDAVERIIAQAGQRA